MPGSLGFIETEAQPRRRGQRGEALLNLELRLEQIRLP
jgi:hypothetical protein